MYDEKAIDALLDRSQVGSDDKGPEENLLANEYLGQFKVSAFLNIANILLIFYSWVSCFSGG